MPLSVTGPQGTIIAANLALERTFNAGAIAVTDVILGGHRPKEALGEILRFVRFLADDDTIEISELKSLYPNAPPGICPALCAIIPEGSCTNPQQEQLLAA